jgi:hypothetical protein
MAQQLWNNNSFTTLVPFTCAECFALQNHESLTFPILGCFQWSLKKALAFCGSVGNPIGGPSGRPNLSVRPNVQERANATRLHTTCVRVANKPKKYGNYRKLSWQAMWYIMAIPMRNPSWGWFIPHVRYSLFIWGAHIGERTQNVILGGRSINIHQYTVESVEACLFHNYIQLPSSCSLLAGEPQNSAMLSLATSRGVSPKADSAQTLALRDKSLGERSYQERKRPFHLALGNPNFNRQIMYK